jgi:hypothetical protein
VPDKDALVYLLPNRVTLMQRHNPHLLDRNTRRSWAVAFAVRPEAALLPMLSGPDQGRITFNG